MTKLRMIRNEKIKRELVHLLTRDYSLKEAIWAVCVRYYLSYKHVERIYYETVISDE